MGLKERGQPMALRKCENVFAFEMILKEGHSKSFANKMILKPSSHQPFFGCKILHCCKTIDIFVTNSMML
jgi:hypothetical protein